MWEHRRGAVTDTPSEGPVLSQESRFPRTVRPTRFVTVSVTGDGTHSTGSLPPVPISPSQSIPLKPSLSTIRTSFRTLRTLGRAS
jgi:hypothetical protein